MYLNCHSHHSLRYGTISIEQLVKDAKQCGVQTLALTDINCSTGIFDFVRACEKYEIKPVAGIDFRVRGEQRYIGIARNTEGFRELNEFLSKHKLKHLELPDRPGEFNNVFVVYPFDNAPAKLKHNEYIGIKYTQLNRLFRLRNDPVINRLLIHHPVTYRSAGEYKLHRLLVCIENNILLSRLKAEQHAEASEFMLPLNELLMRFESLPGIAIHTARLLSDCSFEFDFKSPKNKRTYTRSRYNDKLLLEQLAREGMARRYAPGNKEAAKRVERELEVIDRLGFSAYFLIAWDVIRYSMSRGFYHVGRGSGANSIVAYVLYITDVDPIELNLYFERFLNPSRTSPPDFDIDWSWKDRDEILKYIFTRFDKENTAFCGTIGYFRFRSIIRELGKVYGLPKSEIDVLVDTPAAQHDMNSIVKAIHHYGAMMKGLPNMRSMHSCGVFITEEPLTTFTTLEMLPKGFPTAQIDMYIASDISLEKLDILSQRGIGHINDSVKLIRENRGVTIDIHDTVSFKKDKRCNELLAEGKTLGCFYIESPAMRGLLRRLKCESYEVLVAASSVIRPGVAKSGMMREYIYRHNNPKNFNYSHPVFQEHLGETYGIMVYQEDVIKIAHHFAELGLDEADILRRGMSGKTRSKQELEIVKEKFFENCKRIGHPDELTAEVYRQIESFAGYSFCKSHSASYAVESYQSLFLKAYFPLEFMVAVINNFGGFYRTEVYAHEAAMAGGTLHPPCVNNSNYLTSLEGTNIYLGFIHVQGLETLVAKAICRERDVNGAYLSLEDFINRIVPGLETALLLIHAGSFRFTGMSKAELNIRARLLLNKALPKYSGVPLFNISAKEFSMPVSKGSQIEDAFDETELLGFPVSETVFNLLRTSYRGDVMAANLHRHENKIVRMLGYLISRKNVPTAKGNMHFGTWIDVQGNYFDSTHFPDILRAFPFKGAGCYLLLGKVVVDFYFPSLEILKMCKMPGVPDPRYSDEDFKDNRVLSLRKEDFSNTHRAPYPSQKEVNSFYGREKGSEKK